MKSISNKFNPVIGLVVEIGKKLVDWQNDKNLRKIHSEKHFKTEADSQAHGILMDGLSRLFPNIPTISEEDIFHNQERPSEYWLIDPIDGTASWYDGYSGFVSQAALIINERPVFGVVHAPKMNSIWYAEKGKGTFLNGVLLPQLRPHSRITFIDNTPQPHGITNKIMNILGTQSYLESGSIGLKSVLIADGRADAFVKDVYVRDWDLAPADIILSEVGGHMCLLNGKKYLYSGDYLKKDGFIVARDKSLMLEIVSANRI